MKTKLLPIALAMAFLFFSFSAYINAKPKKKNKIYNEIKKYSPYYVEKRFGGLQIRSKLEKSFKEKPSNLEVFHRLEELESNWGKNHMMLKDRTFIIFNDEHNVIYQKSNLNDDEIKFIRNFYGI